MNEHTAFLRSILQATDNGPRLIYADWLEEHGGAAGRERAELIRAQCALSELEPEDSRRCPLEARARLLLARNQPAWAAPLSGFSFHWGLPGRDYLYQSGFPEVVIFQNTASLLDVDGQGSWDSASKLFARIPVREILFTEPEGSLQSLFDLPDLPPLRALYLGAIPPVPPVTRPIAGGGAGITAAIAAQIARWPGAAHLRTLVIFNSVNRGCIGGEGIAALARSPHLAGLVTLNIAGNDLSDPLRAAEGFYLAPHLTHLRYLNLSWNSLTDEAVEVLAQSPCLANVEVLNLAGNRLGNAAALALASSPYLDRLRWLSLDHQIVHAARNRLRPAGARALRDRFGPRGTVLRGLPPARKRQTPTPTEVLCGLGVVVAGAPEEQGPALVSFNDPAQLAEGLPHLREMPGLTHLELIDCPFPQHTAPIAAALSEGPPVEELRLVGTPVTAEVGASLPALQALRRLVVDQEWGHRASDLSRVGEVRQLRELYLSGPGVGEADLRSLARLSDLEVLHLRGDALVDDAGLAHLAGLHRLRVLSLSAEIGDTGLAHLAGLTELEALHVNSTALTSAGLAHLASLSELRVLALRFSPGIDDEGLSHLAGLPHLHTLVLQHTGIRGTGLRHLAALEQLGVLALEGNPLQGKAIARLRKARPDLLLTH